MKKICILLCLALVLCGCSPVNDPTNAGTTGPASASNNSGTTTVPSTPQIDSADMFTDRDMDDSYEAAEAVTITLSGDTASASAGSVTVQSGTVTITKEGTYVLSGSYNGTVIVQADKTEKVQLVLQNASITSADYAALYISQADKVFVTLASGTQNTLTSQGEFVQRDENNVDAALFSREDLTFNGTGKLTVSSVAGHGIVCKDDLVITMGELEITAASHGLSGKDSVRIAGGSLLLNAGKDGIHAENDEDASMGFVYVEDGSIRITAQGDGISAGAYMQVDAGTFDILAGGGHENGDQHSSGDWNNYPGDMGGMGGGRPRTITTVTTEESTSMKGIKTGTDLTIYGGSFQIDAADDTLHANGSMTIHGGSFEMASGDDAVHAEENLTITDCQMNISTSYEGLEALHIYVSGGDIKLKSSDDGLNAAGGTDGSGTGGRDDMFGKPGGFGGAGGMGSNSSGTILISGGSLYVNASGDGIDANGTLEITGGYTVVVGPTSGDTATLDFDISASITGGTFIGTGALNMAQVFSSNEQGIIAIQASQQAAGTNIRLTDKDGNVLVSYAPELPFQVVIVSTPQMVTGTTYTLTVGEYTGDFEAY